MKKFKELRMTIVIILLLIAFIIYGVTQYTAGNKLALIGTVLMIFIGSILLLTRYNHMIDKDYMVIYVWKIAAMLPILVEYEDIQSIEKKSHNHIIIQHKYKSHIYVFNADCFIETYHQYKK